MSLLYYLYGINTDNQMIKQMMDGDRPFPNKRKVILGQYCHGNSPISSYMLILHYNALIRHHLL